VPAWRQEARFKVSVISGYHFTCALTGYRLIASKSTYVPLEAAHIHAHARKGPDSPDNGPALTPTHASVSPYRLPLYFAFVVSRDK
jgi:predicted restriction endonuclease